MFCTTDNFFFLSFPIAGVQTVLTTDLLPKTMTMSQSIVLAAFRLVISEWEAFSEAFTLAEDVAYICALAYLAVRVNTMLSPEL